MLIKNKWKAWGVTLQKEDIITVIGKNAEKVNIVKLSDMFNINISLKKALENKEGRKTQSYNGSVIFTKFLTQEHPEVDPSIITGLISPVADCVKLVHSWIEFKKERTEMVADYAMNAVIPKDYYIWLTKAKGMFTIKGKTLLKDVNVMLANNEELGDCAIEYLTSRESYMRKKSFVPTVKVAAISSNGVIEVRTKDNVRE